MAIFRDSSRESDRGAEDRARHRELVRESVQENIGDIIGEEDIIGVSGNKKIRVPIRGIKEYRFVYGENGGGVGEGKEGMEPGDTFSKQGGKGRMPGPGGDDPGEEIYETEIFLDELLDIAFEDLMLPEEAKKRLREIEVEQHAKRYGYRKAGPPPRRSKKRTARERLKRKKATERATLERAEDQALSPATPLDGQEEHFPFHNQDLRYHYVKKTKRRESNAVVFCVMDVSGSMDITKKYLARMFYFLLYRFLKTKYARVEVVFIVHHTVAREATEQEFFHHVESGGTHISSGAIKALEIVDERFDPTVWNIHYFHCSDGENFEHDNPAAIKAFRQLTDIANLVGYGEIKPETGFDWGSITPILEKEIRADNFAVVKIRDRKDLWKAFKELLSKEQLDRRKTS
ncbi:MAG: DUF444 family protein [bacterium]|nr:DUF444 family protein [bacterium]